jgi:hypothetical protein
MRAGKRQAPLEPGRGIAWQLLASDERVGTAIRIGAVRFNLQGVLFETVMLASSA